MKVTGRLLLLVLFVAGANGCFNEPRYSVVPSIDFSSIVFKNQTNPSLDDSLIVTINYKDGDGDLGLDNNNPSDNEGIYANKYFFLTNGTPYYFPQGFTVTNPFSSGSNYDTLISYRTRRNATRAADTLPAFVAPYWCTHWDVISWSTGPNSNQVDTLYCKLNPNYFNIFVDFYIKQSNGTFQLFDWANAFDPPYCQPSGFDGRFPVLSKDLSQKIPLEGKIRYGMPSPEWTPTFGSQTLYVQITIQDRALHKSNTIVTPSFDLKSITVN